MPLVSLVRDAIARSAIVLSGILVIQTPAIAATFSEGFAGYKGLNEPPSGWSQFNDAGLGVDSSQSLFWLESGNTTGLSPEGDQFYVRAYVVGATGEGMTTLVSGLVAGQHYSLTFYNASSSAWGRGATYWDVFLNGTYFASSAIASDVNPTWHLNSFEFTATSSTIELGLRGRGVTAELPGSALIDYVQITSAVPEPGTVALWVGALLCLTATRRKTQVS
ncbi:hypothetical protein [Inhella sp.]|uniref:hypothetical protein n=1 Tax=Inhella sp. TaxID=1921806 RepID=UPI0035B3DE25